MSKLRLLRYSWGLSLQLKIFIRPSQCLLTKPMACRSLRFLLSNARDLPVTLQTWLAVADPKLVKALMVGRNLLDTCTWTWGMPLTFASITSSRLRTFSNALMISKVFIFSPQRERASWVLAFSCGCDLE